MCVYTVHISLVDFPVSRNTRLQVEHPVTEMITGLDLVEWQLTVRSLSLSQSSLATTLPISQVARENPLPIAQSAIPLVGHAFEARIYAENPRNNFLPDSGSLVYLSTPTPTHVFAPPLPSVIPAAANSDLTPSHNTSTSIPPSIRLEQGFTQGSQIGVFYDPLIAKLVVHGRDRPEALRALRKALGEYKVVGVSTNVEFLRMLAGHEAFINGEVETGFISVRGRPSFTIWVLTFHRNTMILFSPLPRSLLQRSSRKLHYSWL
jgi:3-methylcrotonyl-CoA carboxylase alpha subunit